MPLRWSVPLLALVLIASVAVRTGPAGAGDGAPRAEPIGELLLFAEGNRLQRQDIDTVGTGADDRDVLIERASLDPAHGRDVNGQICFLPDGSGRFVMGEDTGQPAVPAGWGIFDAAGEQVAKLTATYLEADPEPHGCAFGPDGTLFTTEVGFQGFGAGTGQLIQWFDLDGPSPSFCKLATDLGTAGSVAIDREGRVYVSQTSGLSIERFSPPFPTSATAEGGCGALDPTGSPAADVVDRETFATPSDGMLTFSGLTVAPNGNLYAASVLTGRIAEYDLDGGLVRLLLAPETSTPPVPTGHPQSLVVGGDGTLYYADLDLQGTLPDVGPGPDGKIRRIRFDADGEPLPPEIIAQGLAFPDGVTIGSGDLESPEPVVGPWSTHGRTSARTFVDPDETWLTPDSVGRLVERWRFPTAAVVTASPTVVDVVQSEGGTRRTVFFSSWDGFVYALDWATGAEIWRFAWEEQPGASFPAAGSVTVTERAGRHLALVGAGEILYAIDAETGAEIWRFTAGTGCRDPLTGRPPGLCGFAGERNQIESTPVVAHGTVYVGMDVNDVPTGKGGFFAVDLDDGRLVWWFDVETGATCRPDPVDDIRRFDGYHSEAELGLPAGFLTTRHGCDFDRSPTGCGNVWSSAAYDPDREALYFATSNCDTDSDPATPAPTPIMPPYDEAIVALRIDGTPMWRWRPREVDNDDLAFGAVPNLFSIDVTGVETEVVGVGGKDGTYYVLDRDGINESTGVSWSDEDPRALPYWETNVVPGGAIGGIIATAAADENRRRVFFSTAPGENVLAPQRPTVHALDMDTGSVVWSHTEASFPAGDASYAPTSASGGVVVVGSVITPHLRIFDAADGTLLFDEVIGNAGTLSGISSGAAIVDGTLVVGTGIGARSSGGSSPGDFAANTPADVVALCVAGTIGCPGPLPVVVPGAVEITEGDGPRVVELPVRLSFPSEVPVSVEWITAPAPSLTAAELPAASGTATFPSGVTEIVVPITVVGDAIHETDELGVVRFSGAENATIGGFFGLGIIGVVDDDPPPGVRALVGLASEGRGSVVVAIALDAVSGRATEVTFRTVSVTARSGADYVTTEGMAVIPAGERFGAIDIALVDDAVAEPLEVFLIELTDAAGAEILGRLGAGLIIDDD